MLPVEQRALAAKAKARPSANRARYRIIAFAAAKGLSCSIALVAIAGGTPSRAAISRAAQDVTQRERFDAEQVWRRRQAQLLDRDQALKERDFALRRDEAAWAHWLNPIYLGIIAALIAALANVGVAWWNGRSQRGLDRDRARDAIDLETRKSQSEQALQEERAQSDRVLEVIKTGSPDIAAENLKFLIEIGLISQPTLLNKVGSYVTGRKQGSGAALPTPSGVVMPASHLNMDEYNSFFAQFISHYARLLSNERNAARIGLDLSASDEWMSAQEHRRELASAYDLLIANPIVGTEGTHFVSRDWFGVGADRIEITPKRLRAMAYDAAQLAQLAMGIPRLEPWWYDPAAVDGVTSYFPGGTDNPHCV